MRLSHWVPDLRSMIDDDDVHNLYSSADIVVLSVF